MDTSLRGLILPDVTDPYNTDAGAWFPGSTKDRFAKYDTNSTQIWSFSRWTEKTTAVTVKGSSPFRNSQAQI